jgi:micrococcal nuclease
MMTRRLVLLGTVVGVLCFVAIGHAEPAATTTLTATEAIEHVGEHATVCGQVANTKYASNSRGQPTFINIDRPYPNHVFTIVIWGSDRPAFGRPEGDYEDKRVCVTGRIGTYRGKAQIVATTPSQITIQK